MVSIVYLHDGTFEGLLHAVATAVKSGKSVQGIYPEKGYTPNVYDTLIRVETDEQQALRLFEYLKGLGGTAARFALYGFLSEDTDAGIHLYHMVRLCLTNGAKATQEYTHDSIRHLNHLSRKVSFEAHRFSGLIRFRIIEDGLQYGPFEPDCNIIGLCALHFQQRLKTRRWLLHDLRRNLSLYWDGEQLQSTEIDSDVANHLRQHGELPQSMISEEERYYQDLWNSFHRSIANASRKNPALQRQFMPKRYWKYLVEMQTI